MPTHEIVRNLKRRCNWKQKLKVQEKKGARGQESHRQGEGASFGERARAVHPSVCIDTRGWSCKDKLSMSTGMGKQTG